MTRRRFLAAVPAAGLLTNLGNTSMQKSEALSPAFPSHDPAQSRAFVGASHGNIAKVREMLAISPNYALAATDWGYGDWETALGAASHVGNREIAALLIANGARPDIFYHAMMGHLDAVRAIVSAQPGVQRIPGPHGITLLDHAQNGGDEAKAVAEYLAALGDADPQLESRAFPEEEMAKYLGRYSISLSGEDVLIVEMHRLKFMTMKRGENGNAQRLRRIGENEFVPVGSTKARVRFQVEGGRVVSVVAESHGHRVEGVRV